MRRPTTPIRLLIAGGIVIAGVIALALLIIATESAWNVVERLSRAPDWLAVSYVALVALLAAGIAWGTWRVLRPGRRAPAGDTERSPPDADELAERVSRAASAGVDVTASERELAEHRRRKAGGELYVSLFGAVSTGKSTLVHALLPQARATPSPERDARAGTTRAVSHYRWQAPSGDVVILADVPGSAEPGRRLDDAAREEALRAHIVVYVCDSDLTRDQYAELERLMDFGKPVVVAVNKSDQYSDEALTAVRSRVAERVRALGKADVVPVQAGGEEEVIRVDPDGSERRETRARPPRVAPLVEALQRRLAAETDELERLRDDAVLLLAADKLERAQASHRSEAADRLVGKYSRRAVVGALAGVAPGSDIVIQGTLAVGLVRDLGKLYEVPLRQMDIDDFLQLAGGRVRTSTSLVLAVAGNALKAFPGIGTLTGGLIHAVAYGMIFDSLGRAVAATLAERQALQPLPAARALEEELRGDLQARARRFARLALDERGNAGAEQRR